MVEGHKSAEREKPVKADEHVEHKDAPESAAATPPKLYDLASQALEEMSRSGTFKKIASAVSDMIEAPSIFHLEKDNHGKDAKDGSAPGEAGESKSGEHTSKRPNETFKSSSPLASDAFRPEKPQKPDGPDSKLDPSKPNLASNFDSFTYSPLGSGGFYRPAIVQIMNATSKSNESSELKPPLDVAPKPFLQAAPASDLAPYNTFQPANLPNNFKTVETAVSPVPLDSRNMDMRANSGDQIQPKLVKTISISGPAPGYEGPTTFRPASEFAGGDKHPTIVELKTHTVPLEVAQNKPQAGGILAELNKGGFIAGACDTEEAKRNNTNVARNSETSPKPYTLDATTNSFLPSRLDFKDEHPKTTQAPEAGSNVVSQKNDRATDMNNIMFNKEPIANQNFQLTSPSLTRETGSSGSPSPALKETRSNDGSSGTGNLSANRGAMNDIMFNPERLENQRIPLGTADRNLSTDKNSSASSGFSRDTSRENAERVGSAGSGSLDKTSSVDRTCVYDKNSPELPRDSKSLLEALKGPSNTENTNNQQRGTENVAPAATKTLANENNQAEKATADGGKAPAGNLESMKGNQGNGTSDNGKSTEGSKGSIESSKGNLDNFKTSDKGSSDGGPRNNDAKSGGGGSEARNNNDARTEGSKGGTNQNSERTSDSRPEGRSSDNKGAPENRSNDFKAPESSRSENNYKNEHLSEQSRTLEPVNKTEAATKQELAAKTEQIANSNAVESRKAEAGPEPVRQVVAAAAATAAEATVNKQAQSIESAGTLARASIQQGGASSLEQIASAVKVQASGSEIGIAGGDRNASKLTTTANGIELTGPVSLSALTARTAANTTAGEQIFGQSAVKSVMQAGLDATAAAALKTGTTAGADAALSAMKTQMVQGNTEIPAALANALNGNKGVFDPQGLMGKTLNIDASGKVISPGSNAAIQSALTPNAQIGNVRITANAAVSQSIAEQLGIARSGRSESTAGRIDPITGKTEANLTGRADPAGRHETTASRFDPITGRVVPAAEKSGEFSVLELSQLQKSLTNSEQRYLTGVEIALAVAIASAAVAKAKPEGDADDASDKPENAELSVTYTNADGTVSTAQITSLFKRPTYMVQPNDTLVDIAEKHFHNSDVAWLIADINALRISEHVEEGKRIVELRSRQEIELPLPSEVNEFLLAKKADAKAENMVTIIGTTEIDRELLNNFLSTIVGGEATPIAAETAHPELLPVPSAPPLMHLVNFGKSLTQNLMPSMTALKQQGHNLRTYISKIDLVPHRNVHNLEPQR